MNSTTSPGNFPGVPRPSVSGRLRSQPIDVPSRIGTATGEVVTSNVAGRSYAHHARVAFDTGPAVNAAMRPRSVPEVASDVPPEQLDASASTATRATVEATRCHPIEARDRGPCPSGAITGGVSHGT